MAYGKGGQRREKNPDKIGALWLNESKDGTKYMSGSVEIDGQEVKIVVFKNGFKEEDKHPDYVVYKSKPKDADGGGSRKGSGVPF